MLLRPPKIIKRLISPAIWTMEGADDVYLTFDDGPTPGITEWVLDTLDRYDAKATFFCLGRNVERHPELLQEILRRGHKAGNHTYSHIKGWKQTTTNISRISISPKVSSAAVCSGHLTGR